MRGIDRLLAAILLAGAVGGVAAFARHAGSEPAPPALYLTAPPRQHVEAPQTVVQIPLLPGPARVAGKPLAGQIQASAPAAPVPARGIVVPQIATQTPVVAAAPAAPATPAPEPVPVATPAPLPPVAAPTAPAPVATPAPEAPRVLTVAPPESDTAKSRKHKEHGHGNDKGKGHDKNRGDDEEGNGVTAPVETPSAPAPVDEASPAAADPTPSDESGDHGHGSDHQKDHGHGGDKSKGHEAVTAPVVPAPADQASPPPAEPAPNDESGDSGHGSDHHREHGHSAED